MSTIPLPERPNVEQLKKRAKEIARELKVPLNEAQRNMARGYGFASWPKLVQHVDVVTVWSREPDTVPADDFLALVCLTYGQDALSRRSRGLDMLADDPSLATRDIWASAATASTRAVQQLIVDASEQGGPFAWEPLMYLCYSRVPASQREVLATANALLDGGADPNAGYLWHGFPSPFTALTGVFGEGEQGPVNQPPHPHCEALARLLLQNGADPNDSQALYNRQFQPGHVHLDLLFEFGLGRDSPGPWQQRLSGAIESPAEMLRHQLRWAIHHNLADRVRVLAQNGADTKAPFDDAGFLHCHGRTPAQWAALCGNTDMARSLDPTWQPRTAIDASVGAIMRGENVAVTPSARAERPSLVVQAAATRRAAAVEAAVAHGFNVNALGRSDSPCEQPWDSALHTAVGNNDADMVKLLLRLGADASIEDARFHASPRAWADHFGNAPMAKLLNSLT